MKNKLRLILYAIFGILALVIIADYFLPGSIELAQIKDLKAKRQNYNNAAGNGHYSYKLVTEDREFSVSEDFAERYEGQPEIQYSTSPVFDEVNWYKLKAAKNKSVYSLRLVTGLIVPLLLLATLFVSFQFKMSIETVVFVLEALLIGDVIYLIL